MIEITDVQIIFPYSEHPKNKKLKCYVNIVFNSIFIIRNLRVIEGAQGFFVVMPNFKKRDGSFQDTAHPLNDKFRHTINDKVLEAYEHALQKQRNENTS